MSKCVYNVNLLVETDQGSEVLANLIHDWMIDEESFEGYILLDISQIRKVPSDLGSLSATIAKFTQAQEDIVNALGNSTEAHLYLTRIIEKVVPILERLTEKTETEEISNEDA